MNPNFSIPEWLAGLELGQYAPGFALNEVTPESLLLVTNDDLIRFGVGSIPDRLKLLNAIQQLQTGGGPGAANPLPSSPVFPSASPLFIPPTAPAPASTKPKISPASRQASSTAAAPAAEPVVVAKRPFFDRFGGRFLYISIAAHLLLGLVATIYVVQRIEAKRKLTFQAAASGPKQNSRAIEHKIQVKKTTMSAPASAKRITTTAVSARVSIPSMEMPMTSNAAPSRMAGMGGASFGTSMSAMGSGAGSGGGGAGGVPFFGLRLQAKRIAFLLDYSATMGGPFKVTLEDELERSLKALPQGTEVLLMLWAGPAWLYDQTAAQVQKDWKSINGFIWERVGREKTKTPTWVKMDSGSVSNMMKHLRNQKVVFGTNWRGAFDYLSEVKPAPDVICFITDAQDEPRFHEETKRIVERSLAKFAPAKPVINCFWIRNREFSSDVLKELARRHGGKVTDVGEMPPPKPKK